LIIWVAKSGTNDVDARRSMKHKTARADTSTVAGRYRVTDGPRTGEWFWGVLVDAEGRPWNAGMGYELTGAAAKAQCVACASKRVKSPALLGGAPGFLNSLTLRSLQRSSLKAA
jgi:hypothetical protein